MTEPVFSLRGPALSLGEIAEIAGATLPTGADPEFRLVDLAPLDAAAPDELSCLEAASQAGALAVTRAGACLVPERFAGRIPDATVALACADPGGAFAEVGRRLYPSAATTASGFAAAGISPGSFVHPAARLEQNVTVDPGAVVGPHAEVGSGTVIGSQAVLGPHVRVGRGCFIAAGATLLNALIGDRVTIRPGARIGQNGFAGVSARAGALNGPQIGRVIIQDDVEIGANATLDRGAIRDTVVGEGTRVANLVQIGPDVVIGRRCAIATMTAIAGSATLEDNVALGAQVVVLVPVRIGTGAQIAASSQVTKDVPPGARWRGTPAKPLRAWLRETAAVKTLASRAVLAKDGGTSPE